MHWCKFAPLAPGYLNSTPLSFVEQWIYSAVSRTGSDDAMKSNNARVAHWTKSGGVCFARRHILLLLMSSTIITKVFCPLSPFVVQAAAAALWHNEAFLLLCLFNLINNQHRAHVYACSGGCLGAQEESDTSANNGAQRHKERAAAPQTMHRTGYWRNVYSAAVRFAPLLRPCSTLFQGSLLPAVAAHQPDGCLFGKVRLGVVF